MPCRSHPWDKLEGVKCKNANSLGNSGWFYQLVVKCHPEVAAASSAGLGGKPIPFGQETKKKVIQPLGWQQVSTRQLRRSCLHPKSPNPAPKHRVMLWKRHPANPTLGDPRGKGKSSKAGKEAEPGTGFELVFERSSWGDAAHGATWWARRGSSKKLVGHHP